MSLAHEMGPPPPAADRFDDYWYMRPAPTVLHVQQRPSGVGNDVPPQHGSSVVRRPLSPLRSPRKVPSYPGPPSVRQLQLPRVPSPQAVGGTYLIAAGAEDALALSTMREQVLSAQRHADEMTKACDSHAAARAEAVLHAKVLEEQFVALKATAEERYRAAAVLGSHSLQMVQEAEGRRIIEVEATEVRHNAWCLYLLELRDKADKAHLSEKTERSKAEALLTELRVHMSQSAITLQQHATTIKALSHELVMSKQQTSTIAAGYHRLDTENKENVAKLGKNVELIKQLSDSADAAKAFVTDTTGLQEKVKKQGAALDERDNEIALLRQQLSIAQGDLTKYRADLDRARAQAHDTLTQSLRVTDGFEARTETNNRQMEALRREYADEKRRVEREALKFRQLQH